MHQTAFEAPLRESSPTETAPTALDDYRIRVKLDIPERNGFPVMENRRKTEASNGSESANGSAQWEPRLLNEARDIVRGARNSDYGDPWVNHGNTADVWRWWLKCRFGVDLGLTSMDVCQMNILQKASRLANKIDHEDGWRDQIGFASNGGVCLDHQNGLIGKQELQPGD